MKFPSNKYFYNIVFFKLLWSQNKNFVTTKCFPSIHLSIYYYSEDLSQRSLDFTSALFTTDPKLNNLTFLNMFYYL